MSYSGTWKPLHELSNNFQSSQIKKQMTSTFFFHKWNIFTGDEHQYFLIFSSLHR